MADASGKEITTYHANFVTLTINPDELIMEFRDFHVPHKEQWEKAGQPHDPGGPLIPAPQLTPKDVYDSPLVVRLVVTVKVAQAIKNYLDQTLSGILEARRSGQ